MQHGLSWKLETIVDPLEVSFGNPGTSSKVPECIDRIYHSVPAHPIDRGRLSSSKP